MIDVPRNSNGWPTVEPCYFTLPQLIREARKWIKPDESGTVISGMWNKYSSELVRRGFSTQVEIDHRKLPDDIYGTGKLDEDLPEWWDQMLEP